MSVSQLSLLIRSRTWTPYLPLSNSKDVSAKLGQNPSAPKGPIACAFFCHLRSLQVFFFVSIAASLERVRIFCDIAATNRNWCARVILKPQPEYNRIASCQLTSTRIQTWGPFLESPVTFLGPKIRLSNCILLALKNWFFNKFLMRQKPRGLRSLMA